MNKNQPQLFIYIYPYFGAHYTVDLFSFFLPLLGIEEF